jgi:hypothetical protein
MIRMVIVRLTRLGRQQMQIESRTGGGRRPRCAALEPSSLPFPWSLRTSLTLRRTQVDAVDVLDARIDDLVQNAGPDLSADKLTTKDDSRTVLSLG